MSTTAKTVRVRIAVAVDADGAWNASGWSSKNKTYDADAMGCAIENVGEGEARYWLEADVPLPAGATAIEAEVKPE